MTKENLSIAIHLQTGITKKQADKAVDAVINKIKEALENGETVSIRGFGTFIPQPVKERVGRNINTGETIILPPHIKPAFKASKELVEICNK